MTEGEPAEPEPLVALGLELREGTCYLIKERRPDLSYGLFTGLLARSLPGLCVTRQYPERVRKERGVTAARIVWLCHTPGEDYHNPTAVGALAKMLCAFLEEKGRCVVLLDGLEYLVVNNGFMQSLMFLEHVNEYAMPRKGVLLVPVNPGALDDKEMALLERNLEVVESPTVVTDLQRDEVRKLIDSYSGG